MPVQVPFLMKEISDVGNTATGLAISVVMLVGGLMSFYSLELNLDLRITRFMALHFY